jgi:type VI secretion system protein ImpH
MSQDIRRFADGQAEDLANDRANDRANDDARWGASGHNQTRASVLHAKLAECVQAATRADFFSLILLIEQLLQTSGRIGSDVFPQHEAIRLRHSPHMGFAATDIVDARLDRRARDATESDVLVTLTTTFLGLTGSATPLPLYLAEQALDDPHESSLNEFLDLFHHRALSLLVRWVVRHRLDAHLRLDSTDVWSKRLLALGGVDAFSEDAVVDQVPATSRRARPLTLRLLPLLAHRQRSACALRRALVHILNQTLGADTDRADERCAETISVTVQPWVGDWVYLEPAEQARLGGGATRSVQSRLGVSARLGRRQRDPAACFRVRIGPLRASSYRRCVDGGDVEPVLRETVELFCPIGTRYEIALVLAGDDAPMFAASLHGGQVGRTTWLHGRASDKTVVLTEPASNTPQSSYFARESR